ncbi:Hypothetical_protein [Hexamita inflata]|uniref:Hypothetical_protein n=1 Tax=Hexamita inflata TaxID=28002 RepID=A0ABP1GJY7_9EUKA
MQFEHALCALLNTRKDCILESLDQFLHSVKVRQKENHAQLLEMQNYLQNLQKHEHLQRQNLQKIYTDSSVDKREHLIQDKIDKLKNINIYKQQKLALNKERQQQLAIQLLKQKQMQAVSLIKSDSLQRLVQLKEKTRINSSLFGFAQSLLNEFVMPFVDQKITVIEQQKILTSSKQVNHCKKNDLKDLVRVGTAKKFKLTSQLNQSQSELNIKNQELVNQIQLFKKRTEADFEGLNQKCQKMKKRRIQIDEDVKSVVKEQIHNAQISLNEQVGRILEKEKELKLLEMEHRTKLIQMHKLQNNSQIRIDLKLLMQKSK